MCNNLTFVINQKGESGISQLVQGAIRSLSDTVLVPAIGDVLLGIEGRRLVSFFLAESVIHDGSEEEVHDHVAREKRDKDFGGRGDDRPDEDLASSPAR